MRITLNILLCVLSVNAPLWAKQFISLENALKAAFPSAVSFEREAVYLDKTELEEAQRQAGVQIKSRLVIRYLAFRGARIIGYAYTDTHRVRTLSETILITLDAKKRLKRIEVLSFREPDEYIAPSRWLEQFREKGVSDHFGVGRNIHGLTGASLTARAIEQAARRVLAIHHFLTGGRERISSLTSK